jgi:DNA-binding NarL/FixJ family response regulator
MTATDVLTAARAEAPFMCDLSAAEQPIRAQVSAAIRLLKDRLVHVGDLIDALQRVATGGAVVDPGIIGGLTDRQTATNPLARLTPREREVLELMAQGRSNAGIGRTMYLSTRTVESYVANIFSQLQLNGDNASQDNNRRVLAVLMYLHHR